MVTNPRRGTWKTQPRGQGEGPLHPFLCLLDVTQSRAVPPARLVHRSFEYRADSSPCAHHEARALQDRQSEFRHGSMPGQRDGVCAQQEGSVLGLQGGQVRHDGIEAAAVSSTSPSSA